MTLILRCINRCSWWKNELEKLNKPNQAQTISVVFIFGIRTGDPPHHESAKLKEKLVPVPGWELTVHQRNLLELKGDFVLLGKNKNGATRLREKVQVEFDPHRCCCFFPLRIWLSPQKKRRQHAEIPSHELIRVRAGRKHRKF